MTAASELIAGFEPESDVERRLASDPVLLEGLAWGEPREGHPEGSVGRHVADLLRTIDEWGEPAGSGWTCAFSRWCMTR